MLPRSMDARNRAQDLSSSILSSSSPPQIAASCSAIDSFLQKHASDQSRSFFSIAFPSLICRLFGFDPSRSSWVDHAADNPDLASKLFNLLSPDGVLFSSISAVDRHLVVKYVFPAERLPEWIRFVLHSDKYVSLLSDLCPLFKSRVKDNQIQLNVFEYYMFWFAYYPVCKGNSESNETGVERRKNRGFRLEKWTSSLPSIVSSSRTRSGQKTECNLYLRLLYAYLRAFVPKSGLGSNQPYRSSLLHYSLSQDSSAFLQAEFFVYTLIHFWMVDNDFSPLRIIVCRSFGISLPFRVVLGESPPTPGLGEVMLLLVKYLNSSLGEGKPGESPVNKLSSLVEFTKPRVGFVECEGTTGSWNLATQRPLYRFVLRTFLFCPMGTSFKNAAEVFSLWVTYLTPWRISQKDFAEFEVQTLQMSDNSRKETEGKSSNDRKEESAYTKAVWESYVASNYLFYSSLFVHFLGFAHKFLHTNAETVVKMVLKVLNVLASSKELVDLLRKVDIAYHSKQRGPSSSYGDIVKYVPSIREQLQDWEDGLCETDSDGSFLHENWNHDLKLFSEGEDGAPKLLQLFVMRAEHEIRTISGDLKNVDSIRSQIPMLFGGPISEPCMPTTPMTEHFDPQHNREVFTPKHPGDGKHTWNDVKYRGDWMRRPISDNEVAWLVRLLIRLSDKLNEVLGLSGSDSIELDGPTYLDVPPEETTVVGGPTEALVVVLYLVGSWLGFLVRVFTRFMKGRGMRINLRVLASKKLVAVVVAYFAFCIVKRVFWSAT